MGSVKIYLHAKFRASSLKIEQVMLNFILWRPFCFLLAIFFWRPFFSLTFWMRVIKIYFHAKFWPSSPKIERFGGHFVFHFCLRVVKIYFHTKFQACSSKLSELCSISFSAGYFFYSLNGCGRSRCTGIQIFGSLAQKMADLLEWYVFRTLTSTY